MNTPAHKEKETRMLSPEVKHFTQPPQGQTKNRTIRNQKTSFSETFSASSLSLVVLPGLPASSSEEATQMIKPQITENKRTQKKRKTCLIYLSASWRGVHILLPGDEQPDSRIFDVCSLSKSGHGSKGAPLELPPAKTLRILLGIRQLFEPPFEVLIHQLGIRLQSRRFESSTGLPS